jgi:phage antirepressor YoqD-like protein
VDLERRATPFDSIKYEDEFGEHWFARELMLLMGYSLWRHFNTAINRAKVSMTEHPDGYDVHQHFYVVKRPAGVNVQKSTLTSDQGGRPSLDYRMTREACYFTAMNGDVKKEQVALAQRYFVLRTIQAEEMESVLSAPPPPEPVATTEMPTHIQALRGWADALEAQEKAEEEARRARAEAEELRPPAEAWRALAAAGGDCSVAEAAAILNRDPGITTGPTRLFRWLREIGIVYQRPNRQLVPYSQHLEHVRLRTTPNGTEVRITPDGLVWIQQRLRSEQQRPALTVVPPMLADVVPIGHKS